MLIGTRAEVTPVIVLDVPPDFHQVPLQGEIESRTASQLRVLADMGLSDTGQREALSLYLEALAVRLGRDNVAGTAFCAVELDGHPSTATLTVGLQSTRSQDRGLVVMAAAEAMRREGRYAAIEIISLGGHPALTAVADRSTVPDAAAEVGQTLREISVLVPVPGQERAAMVTLSTPCLGDWDVYVALVLDICRSLHVQTTQAHTSRADLIR